MTLPVPQSQPNVDQLFDAIASKLTANRAILEKSVHYGRLSWRMKPNGQIEVDLEPKL